jgi:hypothetical protein
MRKNPALSILAEGLTVTTGAASARSPIPADSAGVKARYVLVAANTECRVRIGLADVVATDNSCMVFPGLSQLLLAVGGATHIAYIQGSAAGKVNIQPIEDQ